MVSIRKIVNNRIRNICRPKLVPIVLLVVCFVIYKSFNVTPGFDPVIQLGGLSLQMDQTDLRGKLITDTAINKDIVERHIAPTIDASIRKVCIGQTELCEKLNTVSETAMTKNSVGRNIIPPIFDFVKQPCLARLTASNELNSNGECVRTFRRSSDELLASSSECVKLSVADINTPVCIYSSTVDTMISRSLRNTGAWEKHLLLNIVRLLKINTDSMFLDLGCNIGAFTLAAAKVHKHVVAVDPLLDNLNLLSKSLQLGSLTKNVTLVWNAVSSNYSTVTLQKYQGNVGGTAIKFEPSEADDLRESVNTVKLDDLQELFIGKPTIIKMDVETQEMNVLLGGKLFFQTIDVRVVLMEFNWHKDKPSGIEIIVYMESHGFKPFSDSYGQSPLLIETSQRWPGDVFFLKQ